MKAKSLKNVFFQSCRYCYIFNLQIVASAEQYIDYFYWNFLSNICFLQECHVNQPLNLLLLTIKLFPRSRFKTHFSGELLQSFVV